MVSRNSPSLYNQGVYLIDRGECARRQNLNTFLKDAMGNLTVGKARRKSKKQNKELCWCHKTAHHSTTGTAKTYQHMYHV